MLHISTFLETDAKKNLRTHPRSTPCIRTSVLKGFKCVSRAHPESTPSVHVPIVEQRGGVRVPRGDGHRLRRQRHLSRRALVRVAGRVASEGALVVATVCPYLEVQLINYINKK